MDYQYLLGLFLASSLVLAFLVASKFVGKSKHNKSSSTSSPSYLHVQMKGLAESKDVEVEEGTDIIIVGAGVAGSALAYTLGKVRIIEGLSLI